MDAIDLAVIESNGNDEINFGPSGSVAYSMAERGLLESAMQKARLCEGPVPLTGVFAEAAGLVTQKHAYAVKAFLKEHGLSARDIDLLGFHGQTILHRPDEKYTCQIGDGRALARLTSIDVIGDFRSADMQAGGQGGYSRDEEKVREATRAQANVVAAVPSTQSAVHADEKAENDRTSRIAEQNGVVVGLDRTADRKE